MEGRIISLLTFALSLSLWSLLSCTEQKTHTAAAIHDRDSASVMVSYGVNTLISDSGVIKYRIVAERWDVNTIKNPTRWTFEKGLFMEQFDQSFHIEGYIQADSAWYYDQKKLWELRGRVSVRNVNGLVFNSEELWWDGIKHEFYSYQFSRLVTPERTLEGTYFRSDEYMTHYEVRNSVGSFQSEDMESDNQQSPTVSQSAASQQAVTTSGQSSASQPDTTRQLPVRQAAIRHRANQKSTYKP